MTYLGDLPPAYIGATIHLLSAMDIPVGSGDHFCHFHVKNMFGKLDQLPHSSGYKIKHQPKNHGISKLVVWRSQNPAI